MIRIELARCYGIFRPLAVYMGRAGECPVIIRPVTDSAHHLVGRVNHTDRHTKGDLFMLRSCSILLR